MSAATKPDISIVTFVPLDCTSIEQHRDVILKLKVEGNYVSDAPWAAKDLDEYRSKWLASEQPREFLEALRTSLDDPRTVAEVLTVDTDVIGYSWLTFIDVPAFSVTIADVSDLHLDAAWRGRGLGRQFLQRLADLARQRGAHVLRGDTGANNAGSGGAAAAIGAYPVRVVYELPLQTAL